MIKSTLLYWSETWRLEQQMKTKIEATELDALRRSTRSTRLADVETDELKRNNNRYYLKKQLIWYGHIQGIPIERLPKNYALDTTRKQKDRKTKKTWVEGIRSISEQQLIDEDCANWRSWTGRFEQNIFSKKNQTSTNKIKITHKIKLYLENYWIPYRFVTELLAVTFFAINWYGERY